MPTCLPNSPVYEFNASAPLHIAHVSETIPFTPYANVKTTPNIHLNIKLSSNPLIGLATGRFTSHFPTNVFVNSNFVNTKAQSV
jgi:hypothetical protein